MNLAAEEIGIKWCFVVDDDEAFRASMELLLIAGGFACRSFGLAKEFLAAIDELASGVVLLDLRMPELGGIELLDQSSDVLGRFAVMMMSGHGDIEQAVRAIKAGAVEFIEKPADPAELLARVSVAHATLTVRIADQSDQLEAVALVAYLSPHEHEVLRAMLAGAPNKAIARTLGLSVRTIEMHRAHMLVKLGTKTTADALHLALKAAVKRW